MRSEEEEEEEEEEESDFCFRWPLLPYLELTRRGPVATFSHSLQLSAASPTALSDAL